MWHTLATNSNRCFGGLFVFLIFKRLLCIFVINCFSTYINLALFPHFLPLNIVLNHLNCHWQDFWCEKDEWHISLWQYCNLNLLGLIIKYLNMKSQHKEGKPAVQLQCLQQKKNTAWRLMRKEILAEAHSTAEFK